jgi:hypothetical protein
LLRRVRKRKVLSEGKIGKKTVFNKKKTRLEKKLDFTEKISFEEVVLNL